MRKSLISRIFERSEKVSPIHPRDPALSFLFGGGQSTSSGVLISEQTAMTITAVYSAINIVAETIAMLPWNVTEVTDNGRRLAVDDPRFHLLNKQPNRYQNSFEYREMMISHLLLRGRAVSEIIVDNSGVITDLLPLQPDTFRAFRVPDGTIAFQVNGNRILLADEVVDLRGHPDPNDTTQCLSPIKANAEALGIVKAADGYAGSFFGNGTVVSGVLETDAALSDNAYTRLQQWTERHQGVARSHNPAILEEGLTWRQTSINAEDAQLLESRKFGVEDVARIYRIPSYKLGIMDRANFNNVEQQGIDFKNDTILPRTIRLESAIDRAIFTKVEQRRLNNRLDMLVLMRGDSKARADYYKQRWATGSMSANEIRRAEDENGIGEEGDRYYVPVNFMPTDMIGNEPAPTTEPLVRSVFDRLETAQRKILERCGDDEEKLTAALESHRAFIDRNVEPIIESFGSRATSWIDHYYVRVLKNAQRGIVDTDNADNFIKMMGNKGNA